MVLLELDDYCPNPALVRDGVFLAATFTRTITSGIRQKSRIRDNEMGIYLIDRSMQTYRIADTFESFVFDVCLDKGIPDHEKSDQEPPEFWRSENRPAVGRRWLFDLGEVAAIRRWLRAVYTNFA